MQLCIKSVVASIVLLGSFAAPQAAFAEAPPTAERPADQGRSETDRTAAQRELRYAGLSLTDAFRQSLIDDDLEFVFSTISQMGEASGDMATTRYFTGVRAFARGDFSDATEALKDADTEDMMVAAVRTWSLVGEGKPAQAVQVWDAYGDSGRKPFYATTRALLAEQAGQATLAMAQYRIAESTGELLFTQDLAKRYAVLLVKAGKDRDATTMFDAVFGEANTLDPIDAAFRRSLVAKRPEALATITPQAAVSAMMSNFATLRMVARRMAPAVEAEEARTGKEGKGEATSTAVADLDTLFIDDTLALRTALLINANNEDARFTLADMFMEHDEDDAARRAIEPVVTGPRGNDARTTLAGIYDSLENPVPGLAMLDAIPEAQRDADWWNTRSDLLISRGDYAGALVAAQQCVAKAAGRGDWAQDAAQIVLANALNNIGRSDEARVIAQGLVTRLEKTNPIRGSAAQFLIRDASTRAVGVAAARDSLTALGADSRSKVYVGSALARDPATRAEGIQLMRDGAAAYPRSASIMNALGYNLITYDVDLEEGFRILERAHAARPNSGAIMDSFGRAHYKLGNMEEAQRLIEGAVALRVDSPDPEIHDNLGDIYWHQGRREDARAQWRRAKAIGGAYEERDGLDGKIRDGLTTPAPTRRVVPVVAEPGSV